MNTPGTPTTSRASPGLLGTYGTLFTAPGGGRLVAASLVSKLPINMFSLSAVLLLSPRYSYAAAGLAVSVMLVANALSSPVRGRLADRHRAPVVLLVCLLGYVAGTVGLMTASAQRMPLWTVVASVTLLGLCFPPVSILLRGYWVTAAGERARAAANSFESALMDITLVTGPVVATWLSTSASPVAPFVATSALMTVAVALMCAVRQVPREERPRTQDWRGPLRSGALIRVFLALFLFCTALSVVEVVLPVYAQQHGATGYSGWFLAGMSVGSIVGALGFGALRVSPRWMLSMLLAVFAAGTLLLSFAMTVGPVLVLIVCPLTGVTIGASFTQLYTAVGTTGPPESEYEAQGWATSSSTVGFALGAAAGGSVAGALGAPAFAVLTPAAALAAGLLMLGSARPSTRTDQDQGQPVPHEQEH